jgi:hypothetical protein
VCGSDLIQCRAGTSCLVRSSADAGARRELRPARIQQRTGMQLEHQFRISLARRLRKGPPDGPWVFRPGGYFNLNLRLDTQPGHSAAAHGPGARGPGQARASAARAPLPAALPLAVTVPACHRTADRGRSSAGEPQRAIGPHYCLRSPTKRSPAPARHVTSGRVSACGYLAEVH